PALQDARPIETMVLRMSKCDGHWPEASLRAALAAERGPMSSSAIVDRSSQREFWDGARLSIPVIVASGPFALLFGALAVGNGFSVFEAFLMSAAIFGGASQMVGIELFGQQV